MLFCTMLLLLEQQPARAESSRGVTMKLAQSRANCRLQECRTSVVHFFFSKNYYYFFSSMIDIFPRLFDHETLPGAEEEN